MNTQLTPIGIIHSTLKNIEDCPRQESENAPGAMIEIFPQFADGVTEIQEGDQLILFTWLHLANRKVLKTKPRNDPKASLCGIFSTRSPDRPNPIGIHFVTIMSVLGNNKFQVSSLEVLDQTPLIDIKPDF